MATRILSRSILTTKECISSKFSRSYASLSIKSPPSSFPSFSLLRHRPLVAVASNFRQPSPAAATIRGFATRQTTSSLNDSSPNWSNRPPKETILLDGCDFEHWLVVMEKPENEPTRDEIIDSYIKTLAKVIGSEEEARMKIYSVSTKHYFAFGALVSEELSYKIKELPGVRWVLPDSYLDVKNKDYGGEPFINGQAVPYDPKYHEEWVRNNARANERNRRNDRPRNFDRSRNFERRRENMQQNRMGNQGPGGPPSNMGGPPPNMGGPPGNMGPPPNMGGPPGNMGPPPNMGGPPGNMGPPPNMGGPPGNMGPPPNMGGPPGNMGPPPNMGGPPGNMGPSPNMGGPPGNMGPPPNMGGPPGNMGGPPGKMGGPPHNNMGGMQHTNMGGMQYNNTGGPPSNYMGGPPPSNVGMPPNNMRGAPPSTGPTFHQRDSPNSGSMPYQSNPGLNRDYQNSYGPNMTGGNPYQTQDMPGRDMPPPNY